MFTVKQWIQLCKNFIKTLGMLIINQIKIYYRVVLENQILVFLGMNQLLLAQRQNKNSKIKKKKDTSIQKLKQN